MTDTSAIRERGFELVERLLGPPAKVNGINVIWAVPWREDRKPSLVVQREHKDGRPAGFWRDFARDESGDALDLLARVRGLDSKADFPELVVEACNLLGIAHDNGRAQQAVTRESLAAEYGLQWSDFEGARCEWREGETGAFICYPILLANGAAVNKYKSAARGKDGKRRSWGDKGSGFQRGLFCAPPDALSVCEGATLVLAEGEEKALAAYLAGRLAVSPANGADALSPDAAAMIAAAKPARVVIAFDNDEAGEKGATKSAKLLREAGVPDVRRVTWPKGAPNGYDVTDHLRAHDVVAVAELLDEAVEVEAVAPETAKAAGPLQLATITAAELQQTDFPEPRCCIRDVLPEGLTICAGKPKAGKSWFALDIALAVAFGGPAFGSKDHIAEAGEALYVGLEDTRRRLKDRITKLLHGEPFPPRLHLTTKIPPMDANGLAVLDAWLAAHPDCRLVVIDTLARVRPEARRRDENSYQADATWTATLQALAIRHRIALLVVHHVRKQEAADPFDTLSGTLGLTASADAIMVLRRRKDGTEGHTLHIRGRDIEDQELALRFSGGAWTVAGDARVVGKSPERSEALELLATHGPMTASELAQATGRNYQSALVLLRRMADSGEVVRDGKGWNLPP